METPFDELTEPAERRIAYGLGQIGTALRRMMWQQAQGEDMTPTQAQILALLQAQGLLRMSAIAEGIGVRQPTASDAVQTLLRKGYVEKLPDPADGRAVAVRLSAAGRERATRIAEWPAALVAAVETLEGAERAAFLRGVIKIIRALQANGGIAPLRMCPTCRYFRPFVHDDPDTPHHCAFVDAAFGLPHLRLDCDDHEHAPAAQADAAWRRFVEREPGPSQP